MNRCALQCALMSLSTLVSAQERNRNWVYQDNIHLFFEAGGPLLLNGATSVPNGFSQATISDQDGSLQFYTDALGIHTQDGSIMAGSSFQNSPGIARRIMAVPQPGFMNRYVLVSTGQLFSGIAGQVFGYSLIDMEQNAGSGAVTTDQFTLIQDSMSWLLAITPHSNGTDYWAVTHELGTDAFYSNILDATPFSSPPFISHAGSSYSLDPFDHKDVRFSYDGSMLGVVNANTLDLFTFNDTTGQLTHFFSDTGSFWSMEFSTVGKYLYAIDRTSATQHIYQYSLSDLDPVAIQSSKTSVFQLEYIPFEQDLWCMLRAAPDGRIYFHNFDEDGGNSFLCSINNPSEYGSACDVQYLMMNVSPGSFFASSCVDQCKRYHDSEFDDEHTGFGGDNEAIGFAIWPNPASSSIRLRMPMTLASPWVRIHDSTGRLLREVSGQVALSRMMDVSGLAIGLYTVSLLDGSAVVGQARLVIQ